MSTFNFKKFSFGYTPGPSLKGEGRRGREQGRGAPPIHIPGYATVHFSSNILPKIIEDLPESEERRIQSKV